MTLLKTYWKDAVIVLLIILLALFFRNCQPEESVLVETKDVKVRIPEVVGSFNTPQNETELPSKHSDSILYKNRYIYSTHPIDKELAAKFLKSNDSLKNLLYIKSIQERENVTDFSDDKLELKIYSKVQGQLLDVRADYKIKPQEVTVQEKTITKTIIQKDNFSFLAGGGLNTNLDTRKLSYGVDAGIRIKNTILLAGINTNKDISTKLIFQF